MPLPKILRRAAKVTTARTGEYTRPPPLLGLVAGVALRCAAAQTTRRQMREPEPCSYEAEVAAIIGRYGAAIDEARRSPKPRLEIEAIIRALRHRQATELAAVRERRKARAARRPKGMD